MYNRKSMVYHHQTVLSSKTNAPALHTYTPLWYINQLLELLSLPDFCAWASWGITYLFHVFTITGIRTFNYLNEEFVLPNSMFFRNLHTFGGEYGGLGRQRVG